MQTGLAAARNACSSTRLCGQQVLSLATEVRYLSLLLQLTLLRCRLTLQGPMLKEC